MSVRRSLIFSIAMIFTLTTLVASAIPLTASAAGGNQTQIPNLPEGAQVAQAEANSLIASPQYANAVTVASASPSLPAGFTFAGETPQCDSVKGCIIQVVFSDQTNSHEIAFILSTSGQIQSVVGPYPLQRFGSGNTQQTTFGPDPCTTSCIWAGAESQWCAYPFYGCQGTTTFAGAQTMWAYPQVMVPSNPTAQCCEVGEWAGVGTAQLAGDGNCAQTGYFQAIDYIQNALGYSNGYFWQTQCTTNGYVVEGPNMCTTVPGRTEFAYAEETAQGSNNYYFFDYVDTGSSDCTSVNTYHSYNQSDPTWSYYVMETPNIGGTTFAQWPIFGVPSWGIGGACANQPPGWYIDCSINTIVGFNNNYRQAFSNWDPTDFLSAKTSGNCPGGVHVNVSPTRLDDQSFTDNWQTSLYC